MKNKKNLFSDHLKSSLDLVTPHEATRSGFISLALERSRRATPTIVEARNLKTLAEGAKEPDDLIKIKAISSGLLTAAGISDKASGHMILDDKKKAIHNLIEDFLKPAGKDFVEELVYRFLLTRGDSLGGSMRNVGGKLAKQQLTRSIISNLALSGTDYYYLDSKSKTWIAGNKNDADVERNTKGLSWITNGFNRTLLFDITLPVVKNRNIDLVLLACSFQEFSREILKNHDLYIALGELKGGIDPAGADEHWKTARSALNRIRESFSGVQNKPFLFFIGASIEKKMAAEIWNELRGNKLQNVANLTNNTQVVSLCNWLLEL